MQYTNGVRVVTGDELNLVLHKLLEYLGSINSLIASCAFNEVDLSFFDITDKG